MLSAEWAEERLVGSEVVGLSARFRPPPGDDLERILLDGGEPEAMGFPEGVAAAA